MLADVKASECIAAPIFGSVGTISGGVRGAIGADGVAIVTFCDFCVVNG